MRLLEEPVGEPFELETLSERTLVGPVEHAFGHRECEGRVPGELVDEACDRIVEGVVGDDLGASVDRLVEELARHSPLALAMAKRVLNQAYEGPLAQGLELEGLAYGLLQQTRDFREGVESFVEKRPPEFTGE